MAGGAGRNSFLDRIGRGLGTRPRLSDVLDDRHNNFDLIRLVAALGVIYGHSFFEVADGSEGFVSYLFRNVEYSGSLAVYAFFLISGIMISGSLEKHRSALAFVILRFARIWPGFLACCAVTLYVVIPLTAGINWHDGLYAKEAISCLRQNLLFFVKDYCGDMPGAFVDTPMPGAFGFAFWTLVAEAHCYAVVLVVGFVMRYRISSTMTQRLIYCASTAAVCALFWIVATTPLRPVRFEAEFTVLGGYSSYPALFFFGGMICYALRRFIVLDWIAALTLTGLASLVPVLHILLYPVLGYALLVVASIKPLNRLAPSHDVSFGIYIYGTVMLQVTTTYVRPKTAIVIFVVSAALALGMALLSWFLVERPSLRLGRWLVRRMKTGAASTA